MSQHFYTYDNPVPEKDLDTICRVIEDDGVIAYPTDVNWAFGCLAASSVAVDKLFRLKSSHPRELPLSFICDSISMASNYANIESSVYPILKKALPGPFTVLMERNNRLPKHIPDKRRVVGIRIPDSVLLQSILKKLGKPLATTSVPVIQSGEDEFPIHFGYEVYESFGHSLDLVIDLGGESLALETTIIDLTTGVPSLVRKGLGDPSVFGIQE